MLASGYWRACFWLLACFCKCLQYWLATHQHALPSLQVQCTGACPLVNLDKTDGCQVRHTLSTRS